MTAVDVQAQVLAQAVAEVNAQCLGEEYGTAIAWGPAPVQTPQGMRLIPSWQLLLTARNPLLGEGLLYHMVPVVPPPGVAVVPSEEQVAEAVADGLRQLRALRSSKLATRNGKAGVPG